MASWSPSQSDPLTVSYMCQRQSSWPMLPSEAEMPPCAATVCERVGNTLEMQAVFRPACGAAERGAETRAAGADDDDVELVIDELVGRHQWAPVTVRATFRIEKTPTAPASTQTNRLPITRTDLP
jgi:hypothetical protein